MSKMLKRDIAWWVEGGVMLTPVCFLFFWSVWAVHFVPLSITFIAYWRPMSSKYCERNSKDKSLIWKHVSRCPVVVVKRWYIPRGTNLLNTHNQEWLQCATPSWENVKEIGHICLLMVGCATVISGSRLIDIKEIYSNDTDCICGKSCYQISTSRFL